MNIFKSIDKIIIICYTINSYKFIGTQDLYRDMLITYLYFFTKKQVVITPPEKNLIFFYVLVFIISIVRQ